MDLEFAIPNKLDDLCQYSNAQYSVSDVSSVFSISHEYRNFASSLADDGIEFINRNFDALFSILKSFSEVAGDIKDNSFDILLQVGAQLHVEVSSALDEEISLLPGDKFKFRNMLKKVMYLLCMFAEYEQKEMAQSLITTKTKKGKKKKTASGNAEKWITNRQEFVRLAALIFSLPINKLWEPSHIEEEFMRLISDSLFKILENPDVMLKQNLLDKILNLLGDIIKMEKLLLSYSVTIVRLVQDFPHLGSIFPSAVHMFVTKYGKTMLVKEIVDEVGNTEFEEETKNTAKLHSLSQFLVELAQKCPDEFMNSFKLLLPCLEEDSHIIRNCVLTIIGEVVIKIAGVADPSDEVVKLRQVLLKNLINHTHDCSSFVRCKVFQITSDIIQKAALPVQDHLQFLEAMVRLLYDKTSTVRKNALQCLKAFLVYKPYIVLLSINDLKENYAKESAVLKELLPTYFIENCRRAVYFDSDDEEDKENGESAQQNGITNGTAEAEQENPNGQAEQENPNGQSEEQNLNGQSEEENQNIQADANRICEQQILVEYLKNTLSLAEVVQEAFPTLCNLLNSGVTSDVLETIEFFKTLFHLGAQNAVVGIKEMMPLIIHKEPAIKAAAVACYTELYITVGDGDDHRAGTARIAKNLLKFLDGASEHDLVYIEDYVKDFVRNGNINKAVTDILWDTFALKNSEDTESDAVRSLMILSMVAEIDTGDALNHVDQLVEIGLGPRAHNNFPLAKEACTILSKFNDAETTTSSVRKHSFKLAEDHHIFDKISHFLINEVLNMKDSHYCAMADKAIAAIFSLADHPDRIARGIIRGGAKVLASHVEQDSEQVMKIFCRFLFICGHCVYCYMIYLETDVYIELKKRAYLKARRKPSRKSLSRRLSRGSSKKSEDYDDNQDAEIDDFISEFIGKVCDSEILNEKNLFGGLYPIVCGVCKWSLNNFDSELCATASLALVKFMHVNEEACDENMQLLVSMMDSSPDPVIRSNIVIAMADLITQFPNVVEPWTSHMYKRLRDENSTVRMDAAIVLSQLVLHDLIKIKGYISELALCIVDPNENVVSIAKNLFQELSQKKNTLYNVLPDIISSLSDGKANLTNENYQVIIKYIFQFIEKDKQIEAIIEKLCQRIIDSSTSGQLHKMAFSLTLFSYTEKCLLKILDFKEAFKIKVEDDVFADYMRQILADGKKNCPKMDTDVDAFSDALKL